MAFVSPIKISLSLPTDFLIFTSWILSPSHRGVVGCMSEQLHGAKMLAGDNPLAQFLYYMPILLGGKEHIKISMLQIEPSFPEFLADMLCFPQLQNGINILIFINLSFKRAEPTCGGRKGPPYCEASFCSFVKSVGNICWPIHYRLFIKVLFSVSFCESFCSLGWFLHPFFSFFFF